MQSLSQSIVINSPAHEVYDFVINPENTPSWVDGVVKEVTNEKPTKLGTVYKNQGQDGEWAEFEITAFKSGIMFEMTKKGDDTHVRYMFNPLSYEACELSYRVSLDTGAISERFSEDNIKSILEKLKRVIEEL